MRIVVAAVMCATVVAASARADASVLLVAPQRVDVLRTEFATRVRIRGWFRTCDGGECKARQPGAVMLACPDDKAELCWERIVALTKVANEHQCVTLALAESAIHPNDTEYVPAVPFSVERELVVTDADDPLCVNAHGSKSVAKVEHTDPLPVPPTPTMRRSYAGYILLADGLSVATMPLLIGFGGYFLGGPIVHWTKGNVEAGFGSLALRVVMPVAGAALFLVPCGNHCGYEGFILALVGVIAGAGGAVAIDAAVLAREEVPVSKVAAIVPMVEKNVRGLALVAQF